MASDSQVSRLCRLLPVLAIAVLVCEAVGCGGGSAAGEPEAKTRLTKVLRLYQVYADKNKTSPPSEQALREFGQKLSAKERDEFLIGDDLDGIFTSPRDQEKFVVRYNLKFDRGGPTRAIAWEATGQGGKRFVALSIGYVEEYDDQTFKEYSK
jgi:hypothetical protein